MLKGQRKGEKSGIFKDCLYCSKEFYVYPYSLKTGRGIYCSISCGKKGKISLKRTGVNKKCIMCDSIFYAPTWRRKRKGAKFCSIQCYWSSKLGKKPWNDQGKTTINERIRKSAIYKAWRKAVFERDNYTCQICGTRDGRTLNADHIKQFALYPKLRFKLSNGRTLCLECHRKTETYGRLVVSKI